MYYRTYNLQVFAWLIISSILHSSLINLYQCNRIIMAMGLFYYGLRDTTATYATNFLNLIPIVTFIFSTVLRYEINWCFLIYSIKFWTRNISSSFMSLLILLLFFICWSVEKLRLKTKAGKVKLIGAMLCLAGALTITLYKGKVFHFSHHNKHENSSKDHTNIVRGTIFLICSCMSYGCWFLIQVNL